MTTIEQEIAKIEANGRAFAMMQDKVQSDRRYQALIAYSKSLEAPITRKGWEGHGQMVEQLTSSRFWRAKRAAELAIAREGQIKALPGYTAHWLKEAARHRKTEVMYRAGERPALSLAAATDAFCAMLAAPYAVAAE